MYSIGQFAKKVGKTVETIRIWERKGILAPACRSQGGHRMYSEEQLAQVLRKDQPKNRINLGYACVDSPHQKDDLLRQEQLIESYLALKGKPYQITTDIGSGINDKKQGMKQLLFTIINNQVETIYVLRKERLLRFDFELLEEVCRLHDTKIEIINHSEEETSEKESVEEMIKKPPASGGVLKPKASNIYVNPRKSAAKVNKASPVSPEPVVNKTKSISSGEKPEIPGYSLEEVIFESSRTRLWRGKRQSDGLWVLIKGSVSSDQSAQELVEIRHEHEITEALKIDGVLRVRGTGACENGWALILENTEGLPLRKLMDAQPGSTCWTR